MVNQKKCICSQVDSFGKVVVGGSSPSVTPGGYMLGGGHSPMSRSLGLGVDSLIEIRIVTPDGNLRSVKEKCKCFILFAGFTSVNIRFCKVMVL